MFISDAVVSHASVTGTRLSVVLRERRGRERSEGEEWDRNKRIGSCVRRMAGAQRRVVSTGAVSRKEDRRHQLVAGRAIEGGRFIYTQFCFPGR